MYDLIFFLNPISLHTVKTHWEDDSHFQIDDDLLYECRQQGHSSISAWLKLLQRKFLYYYHLFKVKLLRNVWNDF